jgi:hypothetical protein
MAQDVTSQPAARFLFLSFVSFCLPFAIVESSLVATLSLSPSQLGLPLAPSLLYLAFSTASLLIPCLLHASNGNPYRLLLFGYASLATFPLSSVVYLLAPHPASELLLYLCSLVAGVGAAVLWATVGTCITALHEQTLPSAPRSVDAYFSTFTVILLATTFSFHLTTASLLPAGYSAVPVHAWLSLTSLLGVSLAFGWCRLADVTLESPPSPSPPPPMIATAKATVLLTLRSKPLLALLPSHLCTGLLVRSEASRATRKQRGEAS